MDACEKCGGPLGPQASACAACGQRRRAPTPAAFDPFELTTGHDFSRLSPSAPASMLAAPPASLVGQLVAGKFQVLELIGEGGMGQVYRALHLGLEKVVCLKVLRGQFAGDAAVMRRFQREARSASRLHHPNSIQVLDFGLDQGSMYLVMEYLQGRDLRHILADEFPLPFSRIAHILGQVLSALAEAHAAQVVHRDLKPDNIMVEQRRDAADVVKVLDFGIAKILEPDEPGITSADMVCGTPQYMSPEQAIGAAYDGRSDLYAIGVIFYQCVTGELPIDGRNPLEVLMRHGAVIPMSPRVRKPEYGIPHALDALIMRALEKDPAKRPQSAELFRRELLAIAGSLPGGSPEPAAPRPVSPVAGTRVDRALDAGVFARPGGSPGETALERPEQTLPIDEVRRAIPLVSEPTMLLTQAPQTMLFTTGAAPQPGRASTPVATAPPIAAPESAPLDPRPVVESLVAPPPEPQSLPTQRRRGSLGPNRDRPLMEPLASTPHDSGHPTLGEVSELVLADTPPVVRRESRPVRRLEVQRPPDAPAKWKQIVVPILVVLLTVLIAWRVVFPRLPVAVRAQVVEVAGGWLQGLFSRSSPAPDEARTE